ncbi:hypothetical protein D7V77_04890 [Corallococcus sp. CA041A]|uniref:hypothetical protein n=1 Tax=Corallococcus sp. CA041A TaxID=2316727 RepID=UPI000EA1224E|nr:hypothetical protein [Corallococcus sp. CA041A]RKH29770.1 hypothetical protein D7V77_04890 [Corallococcus sp. CA041A]
MMDSTPGWVLRLTTTENGKEYSLEEQGAPPVLMGRLGCSLESKLSLLREELAPRLAARRAAGEKLRLTLPDEALQLAMALATLVPGGWDELSLATEVTCTDERSSPPDGSTQTDSRVGSSPPSLRAPTRPVPLTYAKSLHDLELAACWYGRDARQTREARDVVLGFPEARADGGARAERVLQQGVRTHEELEKLEVLARKHGAEAPQTRMALEEAVRRVSWWKGFRERANRTLAQASAARARRQAMPGPPTSTVRPGGAEHQIQRLKPSSRWTLLIDEGGAIPDDPAAPAPGPRGRFVGLLVPEPAPLVPLKPGWHAMEQHDPRAIDAVVQTVLDAPVGVLGIELDALPPSRANRWVTGVLELIHWVCRLLPMDGATHLTVLIEQRGEFVAGTSWQAATAEMLRHLAEREPERYRQLGLNLRLVRKGDSELNGYVDALAFTWTSTAGASQARLKQSRLREGCLHAGNAHELRRSWEAFGGGHPLPGEQWRGLVRQPDAEVPGAIPHLLLARVREACLRDPGYWQELLDAVRAHMESKAVQLRELGREVEFLSSCMPQDRALKPLLRLAWLTARLEKANHSGEVDSQLDRELDALGSRLHDEAPTLVCQADLDRAVLATNRFDFPGATHALSRWKDTAPAIPGLRHWGRIQSSLGQHAAFAGLHAKAEELLGSALEAFARLSDDDVARAEQSQTATYLAIVTMDTPGAPPERTRERVASVVPLTPDSIQRMARGSGAQEKFAHHLMLRFLVLHGSQDERRVYLAEREAWRVREGHPWPLIELYRALLLHEAGAREEAASHLLTGVELALAGDQGPALAFIGLVMGLVGIQLGLPANWPIPDPTRLRGALPCAPWGPITEALEGRWTRGPLALLEHSLPFNFR